MPKMITLRVSDERLRKVDEAVALGNFPTRAAALSAALDRLLADAERRRIDESIVEGYTRIPPTAEEDDWAEWSTTESIREEPW
jgi:Arc/MetJ-type ribon-helix-helix transcriptional regulator